MKVQQQKTKIFAYLKRVNAGNKLNSDEKTFKYVETWLLFGPDADKLANSLKQSASQRIQLGDQIAWKISRKTAKTAIAMGVEVV